MKIAIDIRSLMESRLSGVQEYTTQLIRGLLRVAPQHSYHLFYNSYKPVQIPRFRGTTSVHALRYPNQLFNLAQFITNQPRWDTIIKADCFLVPNIRLMPLHPDTPLIVTAHDLSFARFPQFYDARRRCWHKLMRPRQLMQRANKIIAVSQATANDIINIYNIPAEKIAVIHSGVATSSQPTTAQINDVKTKYNLPDKFVLFLGTLEPRKNIPGLINAFTAIADSIPHDLVIAGAPGWLMAPITQALEKSDAAKRIQQIDFVKPEDKQALYAAADLFVYPSFYEGFGFPPLEALQQGTPVITSFNSSLPEVVGEYATLIDPYNPAELALVMKELLNNLPTVSEETKQAIALKYSWDTTARKTLAVIS